MVIGSSFAPHTSFFMPLIGSTGPVVHLYSLAGSEKGRPAEKVNKAIYTHLLGVVAMVS